MKQIYEITYPTEKIYIGKDSVGSHSYFGIPDMEIINKDFATLPKVIRKDYSIRKELDGDRNMETMFEFLGSLRLLGMGLQSWGLLLDGIGFMMVFYFSF